MVKPLLAFNIGLEMGRLFIVALVMLLGLIAVRAIGSPGASRRSFLGGTTAVALTMIVDRLNPVP